MLLLPGQRKDSNSMDLQDITMNFLFLEMSSIPKYVLIYFTPLFFAISILQKSDIFWG